MLCRTCAVFLLHRHCTCCTQALSLLHTDTVSAARALRSLSAAQAAAFDHTYPSREVSHAHVVWHLASCWNRGYVRSSWTVQQVCTEACAARPVSPGLRGATCVAGLRPVICLYTRQMLYDYCDIMFPDAVGARGACTWAADVA